MRLEEFWILFQILNFHFRYVGPEFEHKNITNKYYFYKIIEQYKRSLGPPSKRVAKLKETDHPKF